MPIDIGTFESSPEDRLQQSEETNADRVMRFLATHPDQAFTQSEIRDATGVKRQYQRRPLTSRRPWTRPPQRQLLALGEADDVAAYTSMAESTRASNDRFGEENMEEWLEHAVDDEDTE